MFAATVSVLLVIYSKLVYSCEILNRTQFLREEIRLYKDLTKDYIPKLPAIPAIVSQPHLPSDNSSNAAGADLQRYEALFTLKYIQLMSVVEAEQKVDFILEYKLNWIDERLAWTPKEYCGINELYLAREDVWIPEASIVDA
ncbi:hypothetical protein TELCIR_07286 [Teladorsagia circumcincta]|uniref:Neurotransmitter-gated ion-channel ligand-binding domain-containing protein n=1 Tax=Teladorsagia circumcincta TaxID=45464 RepID=A0A2G9UL19_TELCI|nr:hypothetical protein TELCIR_07286 [Teladorsagia circumcincta]